MPGGMGVDDREALTAALARICAHNEGVVVNDDFNFLGNRVNECADAIRELRERAPATPARDAEQAQLIKRFLSAGPAGGKPHD